MQGFIVQAVIGKRARLDVIDCACRCPPAIVLD